ncbi:PREDICTED: influenza virus NS1A-binding protein homolog A-like [Papilio xuthus]|uniref:Influenza virus NS1A-binding protein homolog A-like n=1 Tax=Papilio xuthus TaxID=66420 RepID=A0AAJ7E6W5_PAPXU|nr:PREDICTED: influenza virus NS1A-binding protein homolog A-like [Papilio xuthus]
MSVPRCALGAAELGGRLLVCGGYDRARVLRCAEAYDPDTNTWAALPDMRSARGRFPAAVLGGALYALGGSDGHAELDSVDAFAGGAWERRARLPLARSHAAAAADERAGVLYVAGGWAAGRCLRQVHRYSPLADAWDEAPPLTTGRSQCAGVVWQGELWVLGGCDAWHCLAGTERLRAGGWAPGPALPTARRSVGGAVWRGRLVAAGGSSGGASLRTTAWLAADLAGRWSVPGAGLTVCRRQGPLLREARAAPALCVVRDVLYCAGGFSGQEFLASVECLLEPDGCWTALWLPRSPATQIAEERTHENPEPLVNGIHDALSEREDEMGARSECERDGAPAEKGAGERGGAVEREGESGAVGGA